MSIVADAIAVGSKHPTLRSVVIHTDSLENVHVKEETMRRQWTCPQCKSLITTYVKVTSPPVCNNKKAHTHPYEMEDKDAKRK